MPITSRVQLLNNYKSKERNSALANEEKKSEQDDTEQENSQVKTTTRDETKDVRLQICQTALKTRKRKES